MVSRFIYPIKILHYVYIIYLHL